MTAVMRNLIVFNFKHLHMYFCILRSSETHLFYPYDTRL